MKKRYLVTYKNRIINESMASNILGVSPTLLNEGVKFLGEQHGSSENEILHFNKMGISSISLTEGEAQNLASNAEVLSVEEDLEMEILGFLSSDDSTNSDRISFDYLWNLDLVQAPDAWNKGITGQGVNLAILDTGIADHVDLVIAGGVSLVEGVTSYDDENGHGTHCAGIAAGRNGMNGVYGVAKDCNLYAVKVLTKFGRGNMTSIIAGMEWCVSNDIHVASMSLGGPNRPSNAYIQAVLNCQNNGVVVVCAAGNSYGDQFPWVGSPANSYMENEPNASPIAVGAVDKDSVITDFSSRGTNGTDWNPVTIVGPGLNIYSTYLDNTYTIMSGTSMACPHVAGLAALLLQTNNGASPSTIKSLITGSATNLGDAPYPNESYGYGIINCDQATDA